MYEICIYDYGFFRKIGGRFGKIHIIPRLSKKRPVTKHNLSPLLKYAGTVTKEKIKSIRTAISEVDLMSIKIVEKIKVRLVVFNFKPKFNNPPLVRQLSRPILLISR